MMPVHLRAFLLIVSLVFSNFAPAFARNPVRVAPANPQQILFGFAETGLNLHARDLAVRPGDDFNLHANGAWVRFVRQQAGEQDFSYSLQAQMNEDVESQIREIIENPSGDPAAQQIRDLFAGFMDTAAIEQAGHAPLRPYLERIASIRTRADLIQVFSENGYNMPISLGIIPDPRNPNRYVAALGQGGLLMPTRDYYLREGPEFDAYRTAYRTYVSTLLRLTGQSDVEAKTQAIFDLERRIAEGQWAPERSRDVTQVYNPMTPAQLQALAPQFDWPRLLPALQLGGVEQLIVAETTAIQAAGQLIEEVPLETWKAWLTFHFIDTFAPYMAAPFDRAAFEFNQRALYGMPQPHARWRRGVQFVEGAFGEAVGRIFLARHFPTESRRTVEEMIGNMRAAFGERLRRNPWMDEPTQREALAKLAAFEARVGGPERTIDYTPVRIERNDLVGNILRLSDFSYGLQLRRLNQPVDRGLWQMNAHTVGASYNTLTNQITFPAGILQRPLFDPGYDAAINYGRIGSAIGHELGHGFDDQGRRFDGSGRLRDWWTPASRERFEELTRRLGAQYAAYEPVPGFRVNAENTMGENIGDLGGLEIAYDAYRRHVAQHGEPPVVNGLTGDQRFFLAYAQTWCGHYSDNLMRSILLTDEHAPPALRVNGVVRNMDAWYRAFDVRPGDALYLPPEQRVRIW
jgi:putative endopeptidase